jgi:hypothetical protein
MRFHRVPDLRTWRHSAVVLAFAFAAGCGPGDKPDGFGRGADRDFEMFLGAKAAGEGMLAVDYDFAREVAVPLSVSSGGSNLFVGVDPGFIAILADEPQFFVIADGTEVTIELTAADPGASMKLNGVLLDAPGDTAVLGTMPDIHVHPEWQVVLPEDAVLESRTLTFRATAPAPYAPSTESTIILAPTFEAEEE